MRISIYQMQNNGMYISTMIYMFPKNELNNNNEQSFHEAQFVYCGKFTSAEALTQARAVQNKKMNNAFKVTRS